MLTRIRALVFKELLAMLRDKKSRVLLVIPPILMLVLFANAVTLEVTNVSIGILNRDNGLESRELIRRIEGSRTFNHVMFLQGVSQIRELIDSEKAFVVLHIGPDFTRRITANEPASVQVIIDGRRLNSAQIVQGYINRILMQFNQDLSSRNPAVPRPPSVIVARHWFNPNLDYIWFTVPSLVCILTMTVATNVTALSVARERELGTFDQLLVSPLEPMEILIGKTVPAIIFGMLEGTLMLCAGVFIFHIPFTGSLVWLYISMLVFLLSIAGIGLFISSLAKTQQQAVLGSFMFSNPAITLSGYAAPIENMPEWMQVVTYANPLRYFMVILKGSFLKNLPPELMFANTWPMAVIALFTLTGAAWFFKRRLE
jgi:ABC-2 type transport system permease protein